MDKQGFIKAINKIFQYYQYDKKPNEQQMEMWFDLVKHIPNMSLDQILNNIFKQFDSCPRNIAKSILDNSIGISFKKQIEYNHVEDLRFPVELMQKAFEILDKYGKEKFEDYCEQVKMPLKDRDRVHFKYEYFYDLNNARGKVRDMIERKLGKRNSFVKLLQKIANREPIKERKIEPELEEIPF